MRSHTWQRFSSFSPDPFVSEIEEKRVSVAAVTGNCVLPGCWNHQSEMFCIIYHHFPAKKVIMKLQYSYQGVTPFLNNLKMFKK